MKQIERQIAAALGELQREIQTFAEVTGVKGVREYRAVFWSPFGGVHNQKATELYEKARRMLEKLGAIPEVLRFITESIEEARKNRSEIDKTHTQEEEDQRVADRKREQEAYETQKGVRIERANAARVKAPRWARAAIIAELHVSDCDSMTDYFASHVERTILLGWRSGKKDDFRQMRQAAADHPETKHLADPKYERREKYSMGHGYYLATDRYSGWQVRAISMRELDNIDFEDRAIRIDAPAGDITVRENEVRDGVEIIFPWMPNSETRDAMKRHGFRWSRYQKLWYAKRNTETLAFAQELAAKPESETKMEWSPAAENQA